MCGYRRRDYLYHQPDSAQSPAGPPTPPPAWSTRSDGVGVSIRSMPDPTGLFAGGLRILCGLFAQGLQADCGAPYRPRWTPTNSPYLVRHRLRLSALDLCHLISSSDDTRFKAKIDDSCYIHVTNHMSTSAMCRCATNRNCFISL